MSVETGKNDNKTLNGNLESVHDLGPTHEYHWDAHEASESGSHQRQTAGHSTPEPLVSHHQHSGDVGWCLDGSANERVEVDISVKFAGVQRKRVVYQTAREPV